jgi:hypothetical protein
MTPSVLRVGFALLVHSVAAACGGFFCDNQAPIAQAGEEIVFAVEDGEVVAHVRIQYQGSASDFAWVVPVPAAPVLGTGTDELFVQINARTLPSFTTRIDVWEECSSFNFGGSDAASEGEGEAEGEGGVDVEFRGAVGPYDAAVLTSDDPGALRTWLTDNGYDLPEGTDELLDPYVKAGDHFVALRLLNDRTVGDLVPLVLRFPWDRPCIPIRLTAIALVPNLLIRTWILGEERAIPVNYNHVLLDLAKINWECGASNYTDVVTAAADEASGRAFVTEYAGPSAILAGAVYDAARIDLGGVTVATDAYEMLLAAVGSGLPLNETMVSALLDFVAPPSGMDAREYLSNLLTDCYSKCYETPCEDYYCYYLDQEAAYLRTLSVDGAAAAMALEAALVVPLQQAQALLDGHPMITALFTTLSPDEMTLDPMFGFNADLPEVPRAHQAVVSRYCANDREYFRLQLPDGRVVFIDGEDQSCGPADPDAAPGSIARLRALLPGSEEGQELYEAEDTQVIYSNADLIDRLIAEHNRAGGFSDDGCACAAGGRPRGLRLAWLGLAGLFFARRRGRAARRPRTA